jgi:hypothetical protein
MSYKSEINLANCNQHIYKSLERTACNTSRGGKKKRITQKGGNRCLVPKNPTPSSYWPAPPNPVPSPSCQFPHFRPLVLSQFGGKKLKRKSKKTKRKSRKYKKNKSKK